MEEAKSVPLGKRTATRMAAVQAIFQLEKSDMPLRQATQDFLLEYEGKDAEVIPQGALDKPFFMKLVEGVAAQKIELDQMIEANLAENWRLERIDPVALAILRTGTYELLNIPETPKEVAVNEYLNVAHGFLDEKEVGFINKILDTLAAIVR